MAGKKRKAYLIITAILLFMAVTVYFFQFSQYGYLMTVPYRPAFTEIAGHVYINKNNARDHQEILDLIEQAKDRVRTFFGDLRFWDETVFIICDDERLTRKLGEDHAAVTISFPSEKHYDQCYAINAGSNLNHVYPFNGANSESRTRGEFEGRESIARVLDWINSIPGYEYTYISSCAPLVSARESCRVVGRAYITGDDYVNGVVPDDAVCYSFYPIDVHRGKDEHSPLDNVFLENGKVPGIPYGALVAKDFDNLMMAGRIISGDRRAQSAYRVQASCMAMGEAAGTAAAMAAKNGVNIAEINVAELRKTLHNNGAIVPLL